MLGSPSTSTTLVWSHEFHHARLYPLTLYEVQAGPCWPQWQLSRQSEPREESMRSPTSSRRPSCIGCKWVLCVKCQADGSTYWSKTRLVAKGFNQIASIDHLATFAHVVRLSSIWLLISWATIHDYEIHQMDVQTAFLHNDQKKQFICDNHQASSTTPTSSVAYKIPSMASNKCPNLGTSRLISISFPSAFNVVIMILVFTSNTKVIFHCCLIHRSS